MARGAEGGAWVQGWGARAGRAARACGVPAAVPRAGETPQQATCRSRGAKRVKGRRQVRLRGYTSGRGAGEASGGGRTDRPRVRREELTAGADEGGDVGPLGAGAGTSLHRQSSPRAPAPGGRQAQHSACACRGDLPRRPAGLSVRPTRPTRSRAARADPAAPTARLDPFGSRRAPAEEELTPASTAK